MSYGSTEWQPWILEEAEALPLLKHAYDVGINTWDTVCVLPYPETRNAVGSRNGWVGRLLIE